MSDLLDRILARKRADVDARRARLPLAALRSRIAAQAPPRGFAAALRARVAAGAPAVIAEIKRASPSAGLIRADFDPPAIARAYEAAGAACLSVLTEAEFFQGDDVHLEQARAACTLPVLRKDFVVDAWQVHEARALGADAVLLIVAALEDAALRELADVAAALGLDALVEVHDDAELDRALALPVALVGINNRDLRTFRTTLDTTLRLQARVGADPTLVSESGIHSPADVARLRAAGVPAFLVGEAFMRAPDPGAELERLFWPRPVR
jgi:indole-3-glycerol phosphate synthase